MTFSKEVKTLSPTSRKKMRKSLNFSSSGSTRKTFWGNVNTIKLRRRKKWNLHRRNIRETRCRIGYSTRAASRWTNLTSLGGSISLRKPHTYLLRPSSQ
jgi:hypothetical protein